MFYKDSDISVSPINNIHPDDLEMEIFTSKANKPASTIKPVLILNYQKFQEIRNAFDDEKKDYGDMITLIAPLANSNAEFQYYQSFFELEISKIFVELLKCDFDIQNVKIILYIITKFLRSDKRYLLNFVDAGIIPILIDRYNSELFLRELHCILCPLTHLIKANKQIKDIIMPNIDLDSIFDYLHNNSYGNGAKTLYLEFLTAAISHHDATEEQMTIYIKHICIFLENWQENRSILTTLLYALNQYVLDFGSYEDLKVLFDPFHQLVRQTPLIEGLFTILISAAEEICHKQAQSKEIENQSPDFGNIIIENTDDVTDDQNRLIDTQKEKNEIKKELLIAALDTLAIIFEEPVEITLDPTMFLCLLTYDTIDIRTEILCLIGNIFESMPETIDSFIEAQFFDYLSDLILHYDTDNRTKMEAAICLSTALCMSTTSVRLKFATVEFLQIFFELLFVESNPLPYMIARGFRVLLETINSQLNSEEVIELFKEIDGFTLPEVKQLWEHDTQLIEEVQLVQNLINSLMENSF